MVAFNTTTQIPLVNSLDEIRQASVSWGPEGLESLTLEGVKDGEVVLSLNMGPNNRERKVSGRSKVTPEVFTEFACRAIDVYCDLVCEPVEAPLVYSTMTSGRVPVRESLGWKGGC